MLRTPGMQCLIYFDALTQIRKHQSVHDSGAIAAVSQNGSTFDHIRFICLGRQDVRVLASRFVASVSARHLAGC